MGRPPKIADIILLDDGNGGKTPRVRWEVIVERVRAGVYPQTAAMSTGVGERTFYDWKTRGTDRVENGKVVRAQAPYSQFVQALTRAEAESEAEAIQAVKSAFGSDWRAAAWYAERRSPGRWRRRDSLWHAGPGEGDAPLEVNVDGKIEIGADPDRLASILEILEESGALPDRRRAESDSS